MTQNQVVHVGMINSYNILINDIDVDDILESGVGVFAHHPEMDIEAFDIRLMIMYFQEIEMFEYCAKLLEYLESNFFPDDTPRDPQCECDRPEILEYTKKVRCAICNKRLKK